MTRQQTIILATLLAAFCGCNSTRITDTSRTGVEQLLISNAVDKSLDKVDFSGLAGRAVYVDEKYLESVDKKYIVGAIRQRAFGVGCRLVEKPDEADIIVEVNSGAIGTDRSEGFLGIPAIAAPGPLPVQFPELKVFSQSTQYATAKLGLVAYDVQTKRALSVGDLARARASNSNWFVLGLGPLSTGSLREEIAQADKKATAADASRVALAPSALQTAQAPPSRTAGFVNWLEKANPFDAPLAFPSLWPREPTRPEDPPDETVRR